jgi:hypothetical protein
MGRFVLMVIFGERSVTQGFKKFGSFFWLLIKINLIMQNNYVIHNNF